MTGKRYGCYDPKGEMCIGSYGPYIRQSAELKPIEEVDDYYADMFEGWNREYDLTKDEGYKEAVRLSSSIDFCDACDYKDEPDTCKKFRKSGGYQVF